MLGGAGGLSEDSVVRGGGGFMMCRRWAHREVMCTISADPWIVARMQAKPLAGERCGGVQDGSAV